MCTSSGDQFHRPSLPEFTQSSSFLHELCEHRGNSAYASSSIFDVQNFPCHSNSSNPCRAGTIKLLKSLATRAANTQMSAPDSFFCNEIRLSVDVDSQSKPCRPKQRRL
ncbi:hypothetical protein KC19_1G099500 [Ceratodon purpureus]|uniref:Uncharacterized protein n=1 Tax=Ceratodon purpureus TaxID=3225 RepID=A0A8T0J5I2_CERPU|nr:hypothetical protein KC19_1G099500 [Ceratodon purpureus]